MLSRGFSVTAGMTHSDWRGHQADIVSDSGIWAAAVCKGGWMHSVLCLLFRRQGRRKLGSRAETGKICRLIG